MANARLAIDKAVYELLNVEAVLAVATGGVFNAMAPQGTPPPFVLFQAVSLEDEHTFSGRFSSALYMVKGVSRARWPKESQDVDTEIDTLMEDASLSITGFTHLLCRRESTIALVEEDGGVFWQHAGGIYRIVADQT